jgi:hypothetical protein
MPVVLTARAATAVLQKSVQGIILEIAEPLERASQKRCPTPIE